MLFDLEKIRRFLYTLLWAKTSVVKGPFALPQTKLVAEGVLIYAQTLAEIKVYTCDDILFQDKTSLIGYTGTHIELIFDKSYFDKLVKSKFKSAFFGACAIQVARYIIENHRGINPEIKFDKENSPICLPSHKPEIAKLFYRKSTKLHLGNMKGTRMTPTPYANFISQAIIRGGFDLQEYEVDKKALSFFPIDDVLAAHAVDVEVWNNLYISAERVNRIRALHHYYETDLTKWDGCELQIELV